MNIELGKYYTTRAGKHVGPIKANPKQHIQLGINNETYPFAASAQSYTSSGRAGYDTLVDCAYDIVAEWVDFTSITTAFGLLDDATQAALQNHGGPYAFYNRYGEWENLTTPAWGVNTVYRVMPTPKIETIVENFWMDSKGDLYLAEYRSGFVPVTRTAKTVNGVLDLSLGYTIEPLAV
jgi:hypothetical protein